MKYGILMKIKENLMKILLFLIKNLLRIRIKNKCKNFIKFFIINKYLNQ